MDTQMLIDEAVEALTSKIDDTAIIACSGGIDSTVAAVLANRAIGSMLHCVYVDTGFMRKNETEEVSKMLGIKISAADVGYFSDGELKELIIEYVGNKLKPDNDEVTMEMAIGVIAEEFPELLLKSK